jgi:hypothetical protein
MEVPVNGEIITKRLFEVLRGPAATKRKAVIIDNIKVVEMELKYT